MSLHPWFARIVSLFVLAGFLSQRAQAQDQPNPNLKPTYGAIKLNAGFPRDPHTVNVKAGGNIRTNLGGVGAFVAKAPDYSLHYNAGNFVLSFTVKSAGDTTLLINLPDGTWIADDDSGGNLAPLIRLQKPMSGRYDIYVGTFGPKLIDATLHITERQVGGNAPPIQAGPPPTPRKVAPPEPAIPPGPFNPNLPECFIVSAGIDNYTSQNKLSGCLNDALNTVTAFKGQVGRMFRSVQGSPLLDQQASHANILNSFRNLTKVGAPGDYAVLFLSGHGARTNGNKGETWFFLPGDFHPQRFRETALTDVQILAIADELVQRKRNVIIMVDACYSGQLGVRAKPNLDRYQAAKEGSLTILLSSAPNQTSAALGRYSAFAKAAFDSLAGAADLNRDGRITLEEFSTDSKQRTRKLIADNRVRMQQDAMVLWSKSLSKDSTIAMSTGLKRPTTNAIARPKEGVQRFEGSETLPGYGRLVFELFPGGEAIMTDAKGVTNGNWRSEGDQYTISFEGGAVVYSGRLNGGRLTGNATSPSTREQGLQMWTWTTVLRK